MPLAVGIEQVRRCYGCVNLVKFWAILGNFGQFLLDVTTKAEHNHRRVLVFLILLGG